MSTKRITCPCCEAQLDLSVDPSTKEIIVAVYESPEVADDIVAQILGDDGESGKPNVK